MIKKLKAHRSFLWDAVSGKQIVPGFRHDSYVRGAIFSKDETRILTFSLDNTVRVWDAATGKQIGRSLTHEGEVNGAAFSKNGAKILTWSYDNTARLWDVSGKEFLPER
jgi:WD40 repeat protein